MAQAASAPPAGAWSPSSGARFGAAAIAAATSNRGGARSADACITALRLDGSIQNQSEIHHHPIGKPPSAAAPCSNEPCKTEAESSWRCIASLMDASFAWSLRRSPPPTPAVVASGPQTPAHLKRGSRQEKNMTLRSVCSRGTWQLSPPLLAAPALDLPTWKHDPYSCMSCLDEACACILRPDGGRFHDLRKLGPCVADSARLSTSNC